jgi:ankyrin repeat protein
LFKYKANVNIQDEEGDSPLHLTETEEIARILVENGADPNLKNDDGFIVFSFLILTSQ